MAEMDKETKRRSSRPSAKSVTRESAGLAVARKAKVVLRTARPARKSKRVAVRALRRYADKARRCQNVMTLRRCSFAKVAALDKGDGEGIKYFVTPGALVRSVSEVDEELVDPEAEVDDDREAEQFSAGVQDESDADWSGCDEGDDEYSPSSPRAHQGRDRRREGCGEDSSDPVVLGREYEVDEDGLVYLVGEAMVEWLRRDIEWAGSERFEDDVDMMVPADRLLFYDGKSKEGELPTGLSSANLKPNCFYASTLDDLREGRTPEWHSILLYTLEFVRADGSSEMVAHATEVEDEGGTHLVLRSTKMCLALDKVFASCKGRPNRPERTDVLRSRPSSRSIRRHFDKSVVTFAQSRERECAKCAIMNAGKALCPTQGTFFMDTAKRTLPFRVRCLADLAKWTECHIGVLGVRYCTPKKPKDREEVTARWVVRNTSDVLLVNLIGSVGVNHVVCVDARSGGVPPPVPVKNGRKRRRKAKNQ